MTSGTTTRTGGAGHRHDRHCYWDYRECGWVCGPRPAPQPASEAERQVQVPVPAEPSVPPSFAPVR
jgi:hypothetical protein